MTGLFAILQTVVALTAGRYNAERNAGKGGRMGNRDEDMS